MPDSPLILVVDGNDSLRRACELVLEQAAYRVLTAPDGASALEALLRSPEPVDLVVVDLRLPDMSGHEFVRRARLRIPVLYISADDIALSRLRATGSAPAMLQKPFGLGLLLDRVASLLGRPDGSEPPTPPAA